MPTDTPAQVLIHPTCTTSPSRIEQLQRATGRVAVIQGHRAHLDPLPGTRGMEISQHPSVWAPTSPGAA